MCTTTGSWGWMAPVGLAVMVGVWGVVAWAIYHLVGTTGRGNQRRRPENELAHRFARGDIGADEYREHLDTLRRDDDRTRT